MRKPLFSAMSLMLMVVFGSFGCGEQKTPSQVQTPTATVPEPMSVTSPSGSDKEDDTGKVPESVEPVTPEVVAKDDDAKDLAVRNQPAEAAPNATPTRRAKHPRGPSVRRRFCRKTWWG